MDEHRRQGSSVIVATFIVALLLTLMPLPFWGEVLRPQWSLLVLIYWTLALPERVGILTGWSIGLLMDTVQGTLLGQLAVGYALCSYFVLYGYQRMRIYRRWQQSVVILLLSLLVLLARFWIDGLMGEAILVWYYWLPALTTMLAWAPLYLLLRLVRRYYGVR